MKKKKKWIIVLSILLVALLARWGYVSIANQDYDPGFVAVPEELEANGEELASYLWSQNLERDMWYGTRTGPRIWSYRIDELTVHDGPFAGTDEPVEGGLYFTVSYSVLPCLGPLEQNDWMTGNGSVGEHGWVVKIFRFVIYQKEGAGYRLVSAGSGL